MKDGLQAKDGPRLQVPTPGPGIPAAEAHGPRTRVVLCTDLVTSVQLHCNLKIQAQTTRRALKQPLFGKQKKSAHPDDKPRVIATPYVRGEVSL